jgi:hypothetical protein
VVRLETALKVAGEHFLGGESDFSGPKQVRRWLEDLAMALER